MADKRKAQLELLERRILFTGYYVSATFGSNTNPGTSASAPWKTFANVNSRNFTAGDVIYLDASAASAALTGPLIIGPGTTGVAITSYNGASSASFATINGGTGDGIDVSASNVSVTNLHVISSGQTTNGGYGLQFLNRTATQYSNETVSNVTISGFGWAGLGVEAYDAANPQGFSNVLIQKSVLDYNGVAGIDVGNFQFNTGSSFVPQQLAPKSCASITISDCDASFNTGVNDTYHYNTSGSSSQQSIAYPAADACHSIGGGIVVHNVATCTITHCLAQNNFENAAGAGDVNGDVGIWAHDANNVTIEYSESYANQDWPADPQTAGSGPYDGDGFDLDRGTENSVMEYDFSHGNLAAGFTVDELPSTGELNTGNTVRYCICQNDQAGITVVADSTTDPVINLKVYNNTVYDNLHRPAADPDYGFVIVGPATGLLVSNNIFYMASDEVVLAAPAGTITSSTSVDFDTNDYYYYAGSGYSPNISWNGSSYSSVASWASATGNEDNGTTALTVNPGLTNPGGAQHGWNRITLNAYALLPSSTLSDAGVNIQSTFALNPGSVDFYGEQLIEGQQSSVGASDPPPSPWSVQDYGNGYLSSYFTGVGYSGSDSTEGTGTNTLAAGTWSMVATGAGFVSAGDYFSYASLPLGSQTSGSLEVLLGSVKSTDSSALDPAEFSGLMLRASNAEASQFVAIGLGPTGQIELYQRAANGGSQSLSYHGSTAGSEYLKLQWDTAAGDVTASFASPSNPTSLTSVSLVLAGLTSSSLEGVASASGGEIRQIITVYSQVQITDLAGNLLANPGFETGSLADWTGSGTAGVNNTGPYAGSYAAYLTSLDSGLFYTGLTLAPNTTYVFTGYVNVVGSDVLNIGVSNYGNLNSIQSLEILGKTSGYTQGYIGFTTGPSASTANLYIYKTAASGTSYADYFQLFEV